MKKIIILLCFLSALSAGAQSYTYIAQRYDWLAGVFRALGLPSGDSAQFQTGQRQVAGSVYYDIVGVDAGLYIYDGTTWVATGNNIYNSDGDLTGNRSINAAGFDFQINDIGQLVLSSSNANIITTNDLFIQGDSIRFNSTSGRILFPNLIADDDTTVYKPIGRDSDGRLSQLSYWPGGGSGSSGTDSSSFHNLLSIDDSTVVFQRPDGTEDTLVISGAAQQAYVDSIYRTPGVDSIYYQKDGNTYAIKDSIGSGGGSSDFGIIQAATYTLTSSTSLQKLFDAVTNGEITVTANTTYEFECMFSLSSMSATSGNCGFDIIGAGTATGTNANWSVVGRDGGSLSTGTNSTGIFSSNTAETGNIVAAATTTNMYAHIRGIIRINGAGTIIPSVNLTNAAAAVVGVNSYFKLKEIGNGSVTSW